MKIERFEDLEVWKEARELCKRVFEITSAGPFQNNFKGSKFLEPLTLNYSISCYRNPHYDKTV